MSAGAAKAVGVQERIETEHGIYRIIAGQVGRTFRAVAYVGMKKVLEGNGETLDAAVVSLKQALDERVSGYRGARVDGMPGDAEFEEALNALCAQSPKRLLAVLAAHNRHPNGCATFGELARTLGLAETTVSADYARLGKKLGEVLEFAPAPDGLEGDLEPVLVLATVEKDTPKDGAVLRLRPQVARTLVALTREGWNSRGG